MDKKIFTVGLAVLITITISGCLDNEDNQVENGEADNKDILSEDFMEFLGCACGQIDKVPLISVQDGYKTSYFIAPNGLTAPSDVVVSPEGDIYVIEVRGSAVSKIYPNGTVQSWAELEGSFYSIAVFEDIFYCYDFPNGEVVKISKNGDVISLVKDHDKLGCFSESTIAVNKNDEIFVIRNSEVTGHASLQKINSLGEIETLTDELDFIQAIDFNSNDKLFGTSGNTIIEINVETGIIDSSIEVEDVDLFSAHGIVFDSDDNCFLTSDDAVFKMDDDGVHPVAQGFRGLQGIAVKEDGSLIVVSRVDNGVYKVTDEDIVCLVCPSPLSTPQAIAFNDEGELFISQDEIGMIGKYSKNGNIIEYYEAVTYQPPLADMLIDNGFIVFAESAPGFPDRVIKIPEGSIDEDDSNRIIIDGLNTPSGVAIWDDELYVAESESGIITRISNNDEREEYCSVDDPGTITFDKQGNLIVTAGIIIASSSLGTTLYKIYPGGQKEILIEDGWFSYVTCDEDNNIFVSAGDSIFKISDNDVSVFASGLLNPMGLAFDENGILYVADDRLNAVIKIEEI